MRLWFKLLCSLLWCSCLLGFSYADGLPTRSKIAKPYEVVNEASWTGFYAGVSGSWLASFGEGEPGGSLDGIIGWQQQWPSGLVLGVEADISKIWAGTLALHCDEATISWGGSVRARVGYAAGKILYFAAVGPGFRSYDVASSGNEWATGLVYGGGLEYKLSQPLVVRLEYTRWEMGDQQLGAADANLNDNVLRLGASWYF